MNNKHRETAARHKVYWSSPFCRARGSTSRGSEGCGGGGGHRGRPRSLRSPGPALNEKFLGIWRGAEVFIFSLRPQAPGNGRCGLLLSLCGVKKGRTIEMRLGGGGMWRDYVYELGARMQTATSQSRGVEMYKGAFREGEGVARRPDSQSV